MGWLLLAALAVATAALLWRARFPPAAAELGGAALMIAVAGYAWQGAPGLPGKPTPAATAAPGGAERLRAIREGRVDGSEAVLAAADAFGREGRTLDAVAAVRAALERRPRDPDLWVGLGNAMVAHAGGLVTPAAGLAFRRAASLSPRHPGPQFFLGLAYAQAGDVARARALWTGLLAETPPDAPWRADLEGRLASLPPA